MSRINFGKDEVKFTESDLFDTLTQLIPQYAMNKQELDSYTAICKKENEEIKKALEEIGTDVYEAGGYTAKKTIQHRESMNEAKLIEFLKKYNIPGVVKTRECVDMDALEDYLYNNNLSSDAAAELSSCKTTTEVVNLRVTKTKAKKEDE